jgi:uncharacterized protein YneF (UPF0154 family)
MGIMRTFFGVLGVIIALFSSFFVATALVEIAGGGDGKTPVSVLVGIAVFFGGTLLAGGYLARRMFRRAVRAAPPATDTEVAEKRVLALAAKLGGRTTVAEAAARCGLTVAESREVLERLVSQSVAELLVADDGTMVYAISGLLTPEAKAAAADPIAS